MGRGHKLIWLTPSCRMRQLAEYWTIANALSGFSGAFFPGLHEFEFHNFRIIPFFCLSFLMVKKWLKKSHSHLELFILFLINSCCNYDNHSHHQIKVTVLQGRLLIWNTRLSLFHWPLIYIYTALKSQTLAGVSGIFGLFKGVLVNVGGFYWRLCDLPTVFCSCR